MQFSPKHKKFPQLSSTYQASTSKFEHFEKKDEALSWFISKIVDCKKRGYLNA